MMRKRLALALAGLLVIALAGCSRVPDEKLALVQAKNGQLQALYLQAETLLAEAYSDSTALPEGMEASFQMMKEGVGEIGETVETRLEGMGLAEVDRLLGEIDGTIAVMQELIPQMEQLRDLYAGGGLIEKTTVINEKIQIMNDGMQALVNLVNSTQAAGNAVPESVAAQIQSLSAEMVDFGNGYTAAAASMSIEEYDAVIEKLDQFIGEISALTAQLEPAAAAGQGTA